MSNRLSPPTETEDDFYDTTLDDIVDKQYDSKQTSENLSKTAKATDDIEFDDDEAFLQQCDSVPKESKKLIEPVHLLDMPNEKMWPKSRFQTHASKTTVYNEYGMRYKNRINPHFPRIYLVNVQYLLAAHYFVVYLWNCAFSSYVVKPHKFSIKTHLNPPQEAIEACAVQAIIDKLMAENGWCLDPLEEQNEEFRKWTEKYTINVRQPLIEKWSYQQQLQSK